MILNHVANGACLVVESSPALNTEILRHGDLYTLDTVAVPERLDKRVREAKDQQVVHRSFPQIVVDAKNICFVKSAKQNLVQFPCGCKIMPEGFFNDDACPSGATRLCQLFHNPFE